MTAKTRYFFIGSVMVLVLGLGIGLVAYYGGVPGGLFASSPGPAELKYVPKDAVVVAYANVQDVMRSDLRQRLMKLEGTPGQGGREEFKRETGIDIETDIDYVLACMGPKAGEADPGRALVLAHGRFDEGRLEAMARQHGGQVEQYKGKRLLTATGKGSKEDAEAGNRPAMAMTFIEPSLVAMGTAEMVKQAIDTGASGANITSNAELMQLVGEMEHGSMWAVGRFDSLTSTAKLPAEVAGKIPPITWFAASGRVNGGMQAMVKAETQTEDAANNLRDIIRGFAALAKMQAGNRPEMQAMWPQVELGGTGKTVSVSFAVSSELLDAVTKGGLAHGKSAPKVEKKTE
jgi:hypothetical protein